MSLYLQSHTTADTSHFIPQLQQELDSDAALMRSTHFFTADTPSNRINTQKILAHAPVAAGAAVVVCGPTGFVEASR